MFTAIAIGGCTLINLYALFSIRRVLRDVYAAFDDFAEAHSTDAGIQFIHSTYQKGIPMYKEQLQAKKIRNGAWGDVPDHAVAQKLYDIAAAELRDDGPGGASSNFAQYQRPNDKTPSDTAIVAFARRVAVIAAANDIEANHYTQSAVAYAILLDWIKERA